MGPEEGTGLVDWTGGSGLGGRTGGPDWYSYLVQLDPLLVPLGAGVGDPQGAELGPEQVGGVLLHGGHVEAEHLGGDALGAQVVCSKTHKMTTGLLENASN